MQMQTGSKNKSVSANLEHFDFQQIHEFMKDKIFETQISPSSQKV